MNAFNVVRPRQRRPTSWLALRDNLERQEPEEGDAHVAALLVHGHPRWTRAARAIQATRGGLLRLELVAEPRRPALHHRSRPTSFPPLQAAAVEPIVTDAMDRYASWDRQLRRFTSLGDNWDEQGACAVPDHVVDAVREHLKYFAATVATYRPDVELEPWIAISTDGAVGVEWSCGNRQLAVTFDKSGESEFYARDDRRDLGDEYTDDVRRDVVIWLATGTGLELAG